MNWTAIVFWFVVIPTYFYVIGRIIYEVLIK